MATAKKLPRNLSDSHSNQITILKAMAAEGSSSLRQLQISQIAELSGFSDEKEVQRYLYILEGQKLVTPLPEGDFTSKIWQITKDGVRTLKSITKATTH